MTELKGSNREIPKSLLFKPNRRTYYFSSSSTTFLSVLKKIIDVSQYFTKKYLSNELKIVKYIPTMGLSIAVLGYSSQIITQLSDPNLKPVAKVYNIGLLASYIVMISSAFCLNHLHPWVALSLNLITSLSNLIVDIILLFQSYIDYGEKKHRENTAEYQKNNILILLIDKQDLAKCKLNQLIVNYQNATVDKSHISDQIEELIYDMIRTHRKIRKHTDSILKTTNLRTLHAKDIAFNTISVSVSTLSILATVISLGLFGNIAMANLLLVYVLLDSIALINNIFFHCNKEKMLLSQKEADRQQGQLFLNQALDNYTVKC